MKVGACGNFILISFPLSETSKQIYQLRKKIETDVLNFRRERAIVYEELKKVSR